MPDLAWCSCSERHLAVSDVEAELLEDRVSVPNDEDPACTGVQSNVDSRKACVAVRPQTQTV